MSPRGALHLWLHGRHIAVLRQHRPFRFELAFTEEALDTYGAGSRALSLGLPIMARPLRDEGPGTMPVAMFLEGLLPEGPLLQRAAAEAGVSTSDTMGLLRSVGMECAGAVQLLEPGAAPDGGRVRPLSEAEVDELVSALPTLNLPQGMRQQASLGGIQDKLLLTDLGGAWGWPEGGAASTHLIKPQPLADGLPQLIAAECWTLAVARAAGIRAAEARIERFGGREAIVVARYDRREDGSRIHQEDFCQALGLPPQAKYETVRSGRASRLSQLAALATPFALDPVQFQDRLLQAVTFTTLIGNSDAHAKNYSLLLGERGEVDLAPLYDAAPVMHINRRYNTTGLVVNGRTHLDWIERQDLVEEAGTWGVSSRRAARVIAETINAAGAAIEEVDPPPGIAEVRQSMLAERRRHPWLAPAHAEGAS